MSIQFDNDSYPNEIIFGFVASDTRIAVYLKRCTNNGKYAVRVAKSNHDRYWAVSSHSLSECMREFAESIAQYSGGFTTWRELGKNDIEPVYATKEN